MDIPVLRVQQGYKTLYLGSMRVADMLQSCVIETWDPGKIDDLPRQGYQREVDEKHVARIADWLKTDQEPFMPNGALLSAREDEYGILPFDKTDELDSKAFGLVRIPEGRQLFIVDYQHRWNGLKRAIEEGNRPELLEHVIPVTIMSNTTRFDEMVQFYVINSKQKKIDTDLALALVQTLADETGMDQLVNLVGREKKYRIRATRLTFTLALKNSGPWGGRIKLPHDVPQPDEVLSMKSFADSLQQILSSRSPVSDLSDGKLLDVIENYWLAISALMQVAFASPQGYLIQKTPGVFSMHITAAKTVFKLCRKQRDYSPHMMKQYLSAANLRGQGDDTKYMDSQFWKSGGDVKQYASSSGQRALATLIRSKIEARHPVT